jgi:opacity protein-like surface antigen
MSEHTFGAKVQSRPLDTLAPTLGGTYTLDDYNNTDLDLTESHWINTTLDVSYNPLQSLTTYAVYTFDQITDDQDGREWRGFAPAEAFDPARNWSTQSKDRTHTLGIGATWAAIPDVLNLSAHVVFSLARRKYDSDHGSALTGVGNLDDLESESYSLLIAADDNVLDNVALRVSYRFEDLDTKDFALDGVNPDTTSNTLTFGNDAPDYTAHVIGVSTRNAK